MLLAAGFLGLVNVLQKQVQDHSYFVTGYVWFIIGTFAAAMALLSRSSRRKQILSESGQDDPRNRYFLFTP